MKTRFKLNGLAALALAGVVSGLYFTATTASAGSYQQSNLVSDLNGLGTFTDTNLVNPWGILAGPANQLIVADNHAGVTTFYNLAGRPNRLLITVPAPGGSGDLSAPTDLALNVAERNFVVSKGKHRDESTLLFVTEDGTIAGWSPDVDVHNAILAVDNSGAGAIYKSMALANTRHGARLYAVNFGQGVVEIYDGKFNLLSSFTDTNLASASFVPFGIRNLGGRLFVTFAFKASPDDGDETAGAGLGYVDEFDTDGKLVRRFASQGPLNAPWGLELAPRNFGTFGGALLVGNFGDGAISAYDPHSGNFLGQISDASGSVIRNEGLWGLDFRSREDGSALYFAAGPGDENHGLVGVIQPNRSGHHDDDGDDD